MFTGSPALYFSLPDPTHHLALFDHPHWLRVWSRMTHSPLRLDLHALGSARLFIHVLFGKRFQPSLYKKNYIQTLYQKCFCNAWTLCYGYAIILKLIFASGVFVGALVHHNISISYREIIRLHRRGSYRGIPVMYDFSWNMNVTRGLRDPRKT